MTIEQTKTTTMTPEDKAKELVDTMSKQTYSFQEFAGARYTTEEIGYEAGKKCAIIAVDEILNEFPQGFNGNFEEKRKQYWQEVKQAINKL